MIPIEDAREKKREQGRAEESGRAHADDAARVEESARDDDARPADDAAHAQERPAKQAEGEAAGRELVRTSQGALSRTQGALLVADLERRLLARFPEEDAETWDAAGLFVGDPAALVGAVAVALDPTVDAVRACVRRGANVLVTHHPAYIDAPRVVSPHADAPGRLLWEAARANVACLAFHTSLDVSREAARVLPGLLGLEFERVLSPLSPGGDKGYGQVCAPRSSDAPFTLAHLAARCTSVFGRAPRVWGQADRPLARIACATGSASNVVGACVEQGIDCLVCGELKYHAALNASQLGLAIVELGHDVSELPLAAVLARAVVDAGVAAGDVSVIDQEGNWAVPDATRI